MDINSLSGPMDPKTLSVLQGAHDTATGMFGMTSKAIQHLTQRIQGLDSLFKLGDAVSPEDVIGEAGKMVASGAHTPVEMAGVLADMPTSGGQALAQWVQGHMQEAQGMLQQVQSAHALARHEMGVSGLRLLAGGGSPGSGPSGPAMPPGVGSGVGPGAGSPAGSNPMTSPPEPPNA